MFTANEELYPSDKLIGYSGYFYSVFYRLFPASTPPDITRIFGFIYIALILLYILSQLIMVGYFAKRQTLPKWAPLFFSTINNTFEYFLQPWAFTLVAQLFLRKDRTNYDIVVASLILCIFTMFFILHTLSTLVSLFFYPCCFVSVRQWMHNVLFIMGSVIIPLLAEVIANTTFYIQIGVAIFMIICYVVLYYIVIFQGILIKQVDYQLFSATAFLSVVTIIINVFFISFGLCVPDFMPLLYLAMFVIFYMVFAQIKKRLIIKSLAELERLESDVNVFQEYKSSPKLISIIVDGFVYAHQYCVNYGVLRDALDVLQDDIPLLYTFAKFLTIYPEESSQLNWVMVKLQRFSKKRLHTQFCLIQIKTIMMRRDSCLSIDLRKKIQTIASQIHTTKLRIRNAWEAVLSGNNAEIGNLFERAISSIESVNIKLMNLRNSHSNNPYVLNAYANFTNEVLADFDAAYIQRERARQLQMGRAQEVDQPYIFGRILFSRLPTKLTHQHNAEGTQIQGQTHTSIEDITLCKNESETRTESSTAHEIRGLHSQLQSTIESMKIPSFKGAFMFVAIEPFFFCFVPYVILTILTGSINDYIQRPAHYLAYIGHLRSDAMNAFNLAYHYLLESPKFDIPKTCQLTYLNDPIDCNTRNQLLNYCRLAMMDISDISMMQIDEFDDSNYHNAMEIIFLENYSFNEFENFTNWTTVKRSLQQQVVIGTQIAMLIAEKEDPLSDKNFTDSRDIPNLIFNIQQIDDAAEIVSQYLLEFLNHQAEYIIKIFLYLEIISVCLIVVLNLSIGIGLARWIKSNKKKIYHCFHALPKTTLSQMVQRIDTSLGTGGTGTHGTRTTNVMDHPSTDEQREAAVIESKAITMLRTGNDGGMNVKFLIFAIVCFFISAIQIGFFVNACEYFKIESTRVIHAAPHLQIIPKSYTYLMRTINLLFSAGLSQLGINHPGVTKEVIIRIFTSAFQDTQSSFHTLYFGNSTLGITPVSAVEKKIFDSLYTQGCTKEDFIEGKRLLQCYAYDDLYYYMVEMIQYIFVTEIVPASSTQNITDFNHAFIWDNTFVKLNKQFFEPLLNLVTKSISDILEDKKVVYYSTSSLFVVVCFFIIIVAIRALQRDRAQTKSVLLLLLHAPADIVLQSQYITAILSGDFSSTTSNFTALDKNAFTQIAEDFPDGIVETTKDGTIVQANKVAKQILGPDETKINIGQISTKEQPVHEKSSIHMNKVETETGYLVLIRDFTQHHNAVKQLDEELDRQEMLMGKLLPKAMVEMRCSSCKVAFTVQTVTVMTLALDETTPRIDQNLAQIYSLMVDGMEEISAKYPSIGSIEMMNDNFLIIGGLFDTNLTPENVAVDIVNFSLEVFDLLGSVRSETNSEITAKIGIASGGPVSGGIMSMDIPQFEVFGEVIDFSRSMCLTGLTSAIHITRSVYELVYGHEFNIRERGEVAVPLLGSIVTYLIS